MPLSAALEQQALFDGALRTALALRLAKPTVVAKDSVEWLVGAAVAEQISQKALEARFQVQPVYWAAAALGRRASAPELAVPRPGKSKKSR